MEHRVWKSILTFLLVLALTVGTVAALSMATAAKAGTAPARYSQQVRENQAPPAEELSAVIPEERPSPLKNAAAFALILAVPGLGVVRFFGSRQNAGRRGKGRRNADHRPQRYSPRADMAFPRV